MWSLTVVLYVQLAKCVEIGLPQLILLVIFSQVSINDKKSFFFGRLVHISLQCLNIFQPLTQVSDRFAVHAPPDEGRKTCLWPVCCSLLGGDCVDLCPPSHGGRSLQEHSTKDSVNLQNRSCRNCWCCSLVRLNVDNVYEGRDHWGLPLIEIFRAQYF